MAGEHRHGGHQAGHGGGYDKHAFRKDLTHVTWEEIWQRQSQRADLAPLWWDMLGGRPGLRIADVGCGPGFLTLRYASLTGPTGHVHAVDLSEDALAHLRARLDPVHHAHVTTEALDVEAHPIPDLAFDAVLLTDVLHHADDIAGILRHVRVGRPRLLVAEFDPEGPGDIGPPLAERLAPGALLDALRAAGWAPGEVARQPHEHYAVVAR